MRARYGQIAAGFTPGSASACCGSPDDASAIAALYRSPDVAALPADVTGIALGCARSVALARLEPGQTVLDLGSAAALIASWRRSASARPDM